MPESRARISGNKIGNSGKRRKQVADQAGRRRQGRRCGGRRTLPMASPARDARREIRGRLPRLDLGVLITESERVLTTYVVLYRCLTTVVRCSRV
jgi:hypothetical protein